MEKDEFKDKLNIEFPEVNCDANKIYDECVSRNIKYKKAFKRNILIVVGVVFVLMLSVASSILIHNVVDRNKPGEPSHLGEGEEGKSNLGNDDIDNLEAQDLFTGEIIDVNYLCNERLPNEVRTYTSSNSDVLSVDEEGMVSAVSEGEAIITININGLQDISFKFVVSKPKEIFYNCSQEEYEDFINKVWKYLESDQYSALYNFDIYGLQKSIYNQIRLNPFYIETSSYRNGEPQDISHRLIRDEKGYYIRYNIDEMNRKVYRAYTETIDEDLALMANDIVNIIEILNYDYEKIEFHIESENKYALLFKLCDNAYLDSKYILLDEGPGFNIYSHIKDTIVIVSFEFNENGFEMKTNIPMHYITNYGEIVEENDYIVCSYKTIIDDFNMKTYDVSKPTCFEEVYEDTDFKEMEINGYGKTYFHGYLEEGTYFIEIDNGPRKSIYLNWNLYDDNRNEIDARCELQRVEQLGAYMHIDKSDYYYLFIKWDISRSTIANVYKLEYDEREVLPLTTSSGHLQGLYDYQKYVYHSNDKDEIIKITNLTDTYLYLYDENGYQETVMYPFELLGPNGGGRDTYYINPEDNLAIYIFSRELDETMSFNYDGVDYSFSVEVIKNTNGADINNLNYTTEEYGEEIYYGLGLDPRYLLIKVDEYGIYKFYYSVDGGQDNYYTQVDLSEDNLDNVSGYNKETKEFLMELYGSNYNLVHARFKYELLSTNDRDINISLDTFSSYGDYLDNCSIKNRMVREGQKIRYFFDLEEDSILLFDLRHVQIYNTDDELIIFKYGYSSSEDYQLFKLKAGRYYAMFIGEYYFDSFKLGIETFDLVNYFDKDDIKELELNTRYENEGIGQRLYLRYRVFIPDEDFVLKVKGREVKYAIYDEEMNQIQSDGRIDGAATYNLVKNHKYYIVINLSKFDSDAYVIFNETDE